MISLTLSLLLLTMMYATLTLAVPTGNLIAADNVVFITNANKFCMIVPRNPHTNIGDSERPGGMKTYCSPAGKYSPDQGELPTDFWRTVEFKSGKSSRGGRFAQLTGCINPSRLDRLNSNDDGGQYDSSGGANNQGNPRGSVCLGYNHYVELIEPRANRACIRCCDNPARWTKIHRDAQW